MCIWQYYVDVCRLQFFAFLLARVFYTDGSVLPIIMTLYSALFCEDANAATTSAIAVIPSHF